MRFACLHHGDPVSESLWSAIPLNIVRALRELGHEVVLIGPLRPASPLLGRIKTQIYQRLFKKMYLMNRDPAVVRLRAQEGNRLLKAAGKVDAVLLTYPPNAAYLETSVPVILIHDSTWVQLLDYYYGLEREHLAPETIRGGIELDRMALKRCDRAVYCSTWAAQSAIDDVKAAPLKVKVVPLGASLVNPPTAEDVGRYFERRGKGPMKLFFLGKEWFRKGGDVAVQVASEIERRGVPVELHVVGCEPKGDMPAFVRRYGLLRKDVPEHAAKLRELFESSDFFIMPTRAEAFGIVYAEAAAFGMPVMASDTGGVRDAARGEWSITPPLNASPTIYADWAIQRFHDRREYERLGWLARSEYEKELNWPAFGRALVALAAEVPHRNSAMDAVETAAASGLRF